jgi:hypothetical protein
MMMMMSSWYHDCYRGVGLTFYGYSTKLPQLAADVSRDIGSRDFWDAIDPEIILNCKERLVRSLKSCECGLH